MHSEKLFCHREGALLLKGYIMNQDDNLLKLANKTTDMVEMAEFCPDALTKGLTYLSRSGPDGTQEVQMLFELFGSDTLPELAKEIISTELIINKETTRLVEKWRT